MAQSKLHSPTGFAILRFQMECGWSTILTEISALLRRANVSCSRNTIVAIFQCHKLHIHKRDNKIRRIPHISLVHKLWWMLPYYLRRLPPLILQAPTHQEFFLHITHAIRQLRRSPWQHRWHQQRHSLVWTDEMHTIWQPKYQLVRHLSRQAQTGDYLSLFNVKPGVLEIAGALDGRKWPIMAKFVILHLWPSTRRRFIAPFSRR